MLRRTFLHAPGVGPALEAKLWAEGFHDWDDLLACSPTEALPAPPAKRGLLLDCVRESRDRLDRGAPQDAAWFAQRLPARETWRLWSSFRQAMACVDIETTGLGMGDDHITTIASCDGRRLQTFIHGDNLDDFPDSLRECALLVTFNGRCFDAPFIERHFGIRLEMAHLDLRYPLKHAGLRGGLKKVEQQLGLSRDELDGVDGFWAVLLWLRHRQTGDPAYLEALLAYNAADVLALDRLCARAHNLLVERTPFDLLEQVPEPEPGENPYQAQDWVLREIAAMTGRRGLPA